MTKEQILSLMVDSSIRLNEETHQYEPDYSILPASFKPKGITSNSLVERAFPEMYAGIDEAILNRAATKGTAVHHKIEAYEAQLTDFECGCGPFPDDSDINVQSWIRIKQEHNIEVIATEFIVSDFEHYASPIDILALVDGSLAIIDIKHTDKIHYAPVGLQTSIYKMFFERQCPGLHIEETYVCWLREEKSAFERVPEYNEVTILELMNAEQNRRKYRHYRFPSAPEFWDKTLHRRMVKALQAYEKADKELKEIKKEMLWDLQLSNHYNLPSPLYTISRVKGSRTVSFDFNAFADAEPEAAAELLAKYNKVSTRSESLTIKSKSKEK